MPPCPAETRRAQCTRVRHRDRQTKKRCPLRVRCLANFVHLNVSHNEIESAGFNRRPNEDAHMIVQGKGVESIRVEHHSQRSSIHTGTVQRAYRHRAGVRSGSPGLHLERTGRDLFRSPPDAIATTPAATSLAAAQRRTPHARPNTTMGPGSDQQLGATSGLAARKPQPVPTVAFNKPC